MRVKLLVWVAFWAASPAVCAADALPTEAQLATVCPVTVLPDDGSASGNGRGPIANIRYERTVYLITAAELAASGVTAGGIEAIGWSYATAPGVPATGDLTIYLENTADTTNLKSATWAAVIASMATAHDAATALPDTAGPFDVTLSGGSPFTYTGDGLYVAFDWRYPTGPLGTGANRCTTSLAGGTRSGLSNTVPVTTGLVSSNFRALTRLTPSDGTVRDDAAVDFVIAPGSLPVNLVGPQTIKAVVSNRGANALVNLPVTLSITGPDARTSTQNVASLAACGGQAIVSFPAFTPTALGSDTVTVFVPSDDFTENDSKTRPLDDTLASYSYKHPGTSPDGGVGFVNARGALVSKFTTTGATKVVAVSLEFFAASATRYRVAIYPDSGLGTPGTAALYLDAADRTVDAAGPVTIPLPAPQSVGPGSFYVGIQQTNTTHASVSADFESPVRSGVQFIASSVPPTTWVDFAPGNDFKLNIGVVLDRCLVTPSAASNGPICAGATLQLIASAANAVSYEWTGPNGFTSSQRTPTIPSASASASGAYTVTVNGCASGSTTSALVRASGEVCAPADECNEFFCGNGACQGTSTCTIIHPGIDLFSTPSTGETYQDLAATPLPTGFFGPGSDAFAGRITFKGTTIYPGVFGSADTIVKRNASAVLRGPGDSATIDIEIVALSLDSINPITVTYAGAAPELWDVRGCLSSMVPQPLGSMTITEGACAGEGGTFTSTLNVAPRLVFERRGDGAYRVFDPVAMGAPPIDFHSDNGHWVELPDPALLVAGAPAGLAVDGDCDGDVDPPLPGTSNFFPGVRSGHCSAGPSGTVLDCGAQKKRSITELALTYPAAHVVLPAHGSQGDSDGDGIVDDADNCTGPNASTSNPGQADADDDAIGDLCDNCPAVPSCDQGDLDQDGLGDVCDADQDGDGVQNGADNCPATPNASQTDLDQDGLGDACDSDRDQDAVANASDNCPDLQNPTQTDSDADQVGDACDNCASEYNARPQADTDGDGQGDRCDLDDGRIWEWRDSKTEVAWQAEQGPTSWNVYIGSLDVLQATQAYTQAPGSNGLAARICGLISLTTADAAAPPLGAASFSLVTGVAGGVEGSLGDSSSGPRSNASPCP